MQDNNALDNYYKHHEYKKPKQTYLLYQGIGIEAGKSTLIGQTTDIDKAIQHYLKIKNDLTLVGYVVPAGQTKALTYKQLIALKGE